MRWLLVALVAIASAGLLAVSIAMNYSFGASFGRTGLEAYAYGCAFGFADILKVAAPIAAARSFSRRNWGATLLAVFVWGTFTASSAVSAVGFASANRTFAVDSRNVQAALNQSRLASLQADQAELRRLRDRLATPELGKSERQQLAATAQRLEVAISATRGQLEDAAPVVSAPNPQAHTLAVLTGADMSKIETTLVMLVALLVEVGGLGPFITMTLAAKASEERKVPTANVPEGREASVKDPQERASAKVPEEREAPLSAKVPEQRKPAAARSRDTDRTFLNGNGRKAAVAALVQPPPQVVTAPSGTDIEKDLEGFLGGRARRQEHSALASGELLTRYNQFRRGHGLEEISQRRLGDAMGALGYRDKTRLSGGRVHYCGMAWASDALELAAHNVDQVRKDRGVVSSSTTVWTVWRPSSLNAGCYSSSCCFLACNAVASENGVGQEVQEDNQRKNSVRPH